MEEKLCPMKVKPQSPTTGAIEFDICDKDKCAWWHNGVMEDTGFCTVCNLGWLANIGIK